MRLRCCRVQLESRDRVSLPGSITAGHGAHAKPRPSRQTQPDSRSPVVGACLACTLSVPTCLLVTKSMEDKQDKHGKLGVQSLGHVSFLPQELHDQAKLIERSQRHGFSQFVDSPGPGSPGPRVLASVEASADFGVGPTTSLECS